MARAIDLKSRLPTARKRHVLIFRRSWRSWGPQLSTNHGRLRGSSGSTSKRATPPTRTLARGSSIMGDAACIGCHREIAQTYSNHPMGRSLYPIAQAPTTAGQTAGNGPLFVAQGFEYSVENRNGHVIHKETRRDALRPRHRPDRR